MASAPAFQTVCSAFLFAALASAAHAGTFQVLYTFHGYPARDGANPEAAPIMDSKGDLYGTTEAGGAVACGVVYKLHKSRNGSWQETILSSFQCGEDAAYPSGGVIMDQAGNLYGATPLGGTGECYFYGERIGCGAVYRLSPTKGGSWTETVLYSFPLPNGGFYDGPYASLTFDQTGTLYGTTVFDAECSGVSRGSVFRLKPARGAWKEKQIHQFCDPGLSGRSPGYGALVFDPAGNLYGTTMEGGHSDDQGVAFKLSPSGNESGNSPSYTSSRKPRVGLSKAASPWIHPAISTVQSFTAASATTARSSNCRLPRAENGMRAFCTTSSAAVPMAKTRGKLPCSIRAAICGARPSRAGKLSTA